MDAVPSPRHAGTVAGLCALALACAAALLLVTPGSEHASSVRATTTAAAFIVAGIVVIRSAAISTWPGVRAVAIAFLLVGAAAAIFAVGTMSSDTAVHPRLADVAMLALVVPFAMAGHDEFVAHLAPRERREVAADVLLLTLSLAAIAYVVLRPPGATTAAAVSAATFAILAASIVAVFGALAVWLPTRGHLLVFLCFALLAVATIRFGAAWTGVTGPAPSWSGIVYVVVPLALAGIYRSLPHAAGRPPSDGSTRIARPLLTSVTVIAACAALSVVAVLDDARGIAGAHATVLLLLLGVGIAVRILTNQLASAEAFTHTQDALARQEAALTATDAALDRVQEANESLRRSEEHLRLVFDAAVDGFVELDDRGQILRANDAFAHMVSLDAVAVARHVVGGAGRGDRRRGSRLRSSRRRWSGDDQPIRRSHSPPGSDRLRDPHRPAADPRARPRRQRGEGGRPDDPIALPVPAGPRRGSNAAAPAIERRDRTGTQPDRARSP